MQQSIVRMIGSRTCIIASLVMATTAWAGPTPVSPTSEEELPPVPRAAAEQLMVTAAIPVAAHQISETAQGHDVFIDGFGYLLVPGKPALPSRIFAIAIPPGAEMVSVDFDAGEGVVLPGTYRIRPSGLPRVIGEEDPLLYARDKQQYDENYESVYGSDDPYPASVAEFVRTAGYRKYNLVDVRVTPFTYRPLSGELTYYPNITVNVQFEYPEKRGEVIIDDLPRTERVASEIVLNYDETESWYGAAKADSRGLHDYVIITLDSLTAAVTPLVSWETYKGRTVEVVTTSWIYSNYGGYDSAAKIRAFLRDKYPSDDWGIEDVLLVGHYDNVPMRRTWQDVGYGMPETDLYYAELSLADSQSWDADGDHKWGEDSDPIDFYSEISVGRIPWSDAATVQSICEKTVAYEQNDDPAFKKNILLLGAYFWPDTDNAVLMEAKVDQDWMSDWTMTRMYEKNADYWSTYACDYPLLHSNVVSVWSSGQYAFVNWAGHGSPTSSHIYGLGAPAFIAASDGPTIGNDYPAIVFADACSNADTDYLNIGQALLKDGAVGFVGATKVAFGAGGWTGPYSGSGQSFDYFFTTRVTSGDYTQGAGHQSALRQMYTQGLWYYTYYEMFEWGSIWGNPNLGMNQILPFTLTLPDGVPDNVVPATATPITLEILSGGEQYVTGSGTLHYRYDGGDFLTSTVASIGGDLYQAILPPADCDATPEYYFSAQGDGGSTVTNPVDAPASTYTSVVGELAPMFTDDFETHQGWVIQSEATLTDGAWERGVPVGLGERGDPPTDFDGSGQCYLTDNEYGNSDVDGGYTRIVSPTFDLSGGDGQIHYALWYTNDFLGNPNEDEFKVYVSNTNGVAWTLAETIGPDSPPEEWIEHTFWFGDVLPPTGAVKVRFEVSDYIGASIVEAGLDDFSVSVFECSMPDIVAPMPEDSLGVVCEGDAECEFAAKCVQGVCYAPKHRYVSVRTNPAQAGDTARRVKLISGETLGWVGTPYESAGLWIAEVVAAPVYVTQWPEVTHVTGCPIATGQTYVIQAIASGKDIGEESNYSGGVELHTPAVWGDTVSTCEGNVCKPPNGIVGLDDVVAGIKKYQAVDVAPLTWLDIDPSGQEDKPNQVIGIGDILACIDGFQGKTYPGHGPLSCP